MFFFFTYFFTATLTIFHTQQKLSSLTKKKQTKNFYPIHTCSVIPFKESKCINTLIFCLNLQVKQRYLFIFLLKGPYRSYYSWKKNIFFPKKWLYAYLISWTRNWFLKSWTCRCKLFTFSHARTPTTWEWNNWAQCSGHSLKLEEHGPLFDEQKFWLQFISQATSSIRSQSCPEYCVTQKTSGQDDHCQWFESGKIYFTLRTPPNNCNINVCAECAP